MASLNFHRRHGPCRGCREAAEASRVSAACRQGAHADQETTAKNVHDVLIRNLDELRRLKPDKLVRKRREKYLRMGQFQE